MKTTRNINKSAQEKEEIIDILEKDRDEFHKKLTHIWKEKKKVQNKVYRAQEEINYLEIQINNVTSSHFYKLWQAYTSIITIITMSFKHARQNSQPSS